MKTGFLKAAFNIKNIVAAERRKDSEKHAVFFVLSAFSAANQLVLPAALWRSVRCLAAGLLCLGLFPSPAAETSAASPPASEIAELSELGTNVLELLQSGAAVHFAKSAAPALDDFKSILSTNPAVPSTDPLAPFRSLTETKRRQIERSAKEVLDRAAQLKLDFSKGDWQARVLPPQASGFVTFGDLQATNQMQPRIDSLEIVLESPTAGAASTNGAFKLLARTLVKFPAGWKCLEGIYWEAFPANVADEKTRRELIIFNKLSAGGRLDGQDDPALLKLGERLVNFLRRQDPDLFQKEVLITADLMWDRFQKTGRSGHPREELDKQISAIATRQTALAMQCFAQLTNAGVDFSQAEIRIGSATVEQVRSAAASDSLNGLSGEQFKLDLEVKSDAKAANGRPVSGHYILGASEVTRFDEDWRVFDRLHWQQLPEGILGREEAEKISVENYVTEHRALPPGTSAPEITFTALEGEKSMKLSDFKGKVVILDFWATWCGPCQEPMAELQKLGAAHPDWKDKVLIVPLSIDDALGTVRRHIDQRGWTNTFNVWAGEGGWQAPPPVAFRVSGVPTIYIIDGAGKIAAAGHPSGLNIARIVDSLLHAEGKPQP